MTPTIGDHVMTIVKSGTGLEVFMPTNVSDIIAAIETDLGRIVQGLAAARQADASGGADTTRILSALAALKIDTGSAAERLTALPLEMKPLALLSLDSEQLTLIKGIDGQAAGILNDNGLHRFADIAALMPEDVKELSSQLGDRRRIARQGWIEQAALLAGGIETAHAARIRAGDFASVVRLPAEPLPTTSVPAVTAATAPTTPAPSAPVIDLASQRADRQRKAPASVGRVAGMALAAALVLGFTLNAGTIVGMAWGVSSKSSCAPAARGGIPAGKCTVAQLP